MKKNMAPALGILAVGAACFLLFRGQPDGAAGPVKFSGIKIQSPGQWEPAPTLTLVSPSAPTATVRRNEPIECIARIQLGDGETLPSFIAMSIKRAGETYTSAVPTLELEGEGVYLCRFLFEAGLRAPGSYEVEVECQDYFSRSRFWGTPETRTTAKVTSTLTVR